MKKLLITLISLTLAGLAQFSSADDLLAWAEMSKGSYVAPGCAWQAGGATSYGPVLGLYCNGSYAATRTPNRYGPETVTASSGYYVVPHSGGSAPINGYNYAVYKRAVAPTCATRGTIIAYYGDLTTASQNYNSDAQKCGTGCQIQITANGPGYKNVCY